MKKNKVQVEFSHYEFSKYINPERWSSYYWQIEYINRVKKIKSKSILSILEIGPGGGIVTAILRQLGHDVDTLDIDKKSKPTYMQSLPHIAIKEKYDVILCCEVLEHIPFSDVVLSINKFSSISDHLVISVPHKSLYLSFRLQVSLSKPVRILINNKRSFTRYVFNGEHYWELGTIGYSQEKFIHTFEEQQYELLRHERIKEFPYHHFFLFRKFLNIK